MATNTSATEVRERGNGPSAAAKRPLPASAKFTNDASRLPRVLLIGPVPAPRGGVSVHLERLAIALAGLGYPIDVLDEAPIIKAHVPNLRKISLRSYVSLLRNADIIHTHSSNPAVKLAHTILARLLGRRVVATIHSARHDVWGRMMYRLACRLSHCVIPVSEQVRDTLKIKGEIIPAFLPPLVEEECIPESLAAWMQERRLEGRQIIVSNASDLRSAHGEDLYGLDLLVEAFTRPEVSRRYALLFVVASLRVGAARYADMQWAIDDRELSSVVKLVHLAAPFAGMIKAADLVVRATNTDGDALTVREALWYGKRVLASDCVKRPERSDLFRSRDVEDLVLKLVALGPPEPGGELRRDFTADVDRVYRRIGVGQTPASTALPEPQPRKKQRILVISQFYEPDITAAAFRIGETVTLLRNVADVRVITAVPHKAQVSKRLGPDDPGVIRVSIWQYQGGGAANYVMHYLSFVVTAVWAGAKLALSGWRADVIWASSPPLTIGVAGDVLRRIMRCPMVLDVRDIWPESAVGAKMIAPDSILFRIGKILEKRLYASSARMTCVSRSMRDYLVAASGKPVHVVYNGVVGARIPHPEIDQVKRRILYAGNLGRAQGLDALLTAFARSRRASGLMTGWTVELVGAGALEDELRAQVAELGLEGSINFGGVLSKLAALAEMRNSGALFINLLDDPVFALTVPSKVFDYMLADRPILFGVDNPEARAILDESGGNIGFATNDVSSLAAAMVDMVTRLEQLETLARGNSAIVRSRYTREESTAELLGALAAAQGNE